MTHAHLVAPAASTAGLILSLVNTLPAHAAPLRRRAHAIAARLARPHDRAVDNRAAALLAQLLDVTDCADLAGYPDEGLLDADFDL